LTLTVGRASADSDVQCTYDVTEPGVPYPTQSYELSMGIGAQILRLLGGPQARPRVVSFMHSQRGSQDAYRAVLGCPVRFNQTWSGFELPRMLPTRPSTPPIPRPDASRRSTWNPPTCPALPRCPNAWPN
jgi:hypothetical protein